MLRALLFNSVVLQDSYSWTTMYNLSSRAQPVPSH